MRGTEKVAAPPLFRVRTKPSQTWRTEGTREALLFLTSPASEQPILVREHDTKFEGGFDGVLRKNEVRVQEVGPQAPNLNAIAERWMQTVEIECLEHFVVFGEAHLRCLLDEFLEHYHLFRPHQGLSNRLLCCANPPVVRPAAMGDIECEQRLGGLRSTIEVGLLDGFPFAIPQSNCCVHVDVALCSSPKRPTLVRGPWIQRSRRRFVAQQWAWFAVDS